MLEKPDSTGQVSSSMRRVRRLYGGRGPRMEMLSQWGDEYYQWTQEMQKRST